MFHKRLALAQPLVVGETPAFTPRGLIRGTSPQTTNTTRALAAFNLFVLTETDGISLWKWWSFPVAFDVHVAVISETFASCRLQDVMKPEFHFWIASSLHYMSGKIIVIVSYVYCIYNILPRPEIARAGLSKLPYIGLWWWLVTSCAQLGTKMMHSNRRRCLFRLSLQKTLFCFAKHKTSELALGSWVSVSFLPGTFITQAVPVPPANYRRYSHRIRAVDVIMGPCCARVTKPAAGLHKHWGQHLALHCLIDFHSSRHAFRVIIIWLS